MRQLDAKILENSAVKQGFYRMRLESPYLAKNTKPGQFFEVKCSDSNKPLLRRPLGAHRLLKNSVEILYETVGIGTTLLSRMKRGGYLDIIGPLGNGFFVQHMADPPGLRGRRAGGSVQRTAILAAGGIGIAPLFALADDLRKRKNKVIVIIGAKTRTHILCENELKSLGCEVEISTEDGSYGEKGLATDLLRHLLSTMNYKLSTIYACGPTAMLKAIAKIVGRRKIPCQVSLEERMACGVGVCLGCPVKVRGIDSSRVLGCASSRVRGHTNTRTREHANKYKMVCKDGPVFDAEEIAW